MGRFRTKRGTCFVSDGNIRLHESYAGQLKRYYEGAKQSRHGLALVSNLFLFPPLSVLYIILSEPGILLYLLGLAAVIAIFGYLVDYVPGFRRVETIPLGEITKVQAVEGSSWTHPRFVVEYGYGNQTNKRRIRLPSRYFAFTEREFERAKQLFEEHSVLVRN